MLWLNAAARPIAPVGPLSVNAYSTDSVTLSWQPPDDSNLISSYRIEKRESTRHKWDVAGTADFRDTSYTVRSLRPGTDYFFRVVAENVAGTSAPLVMDRSFVPKAPIGKS